MNVYILYTSEITTEGELCTDCSHLYKSLQEAQDEQNIVLDVWAKRHENNLIKEQIGWYKRYAVKDNIAEIQTCVKMFDISEFCTM